MTILTARIGGLAVGVVALLGVGAQLAAAAEAPAVAAGTRSSTGQGRTAGAEWAMSDTSVTAQSASPSSVACLRKEYQQGNAVLFKDICTKESAINPPVTQ